MFNFYSIVYMHYIHTILDTMYYSIYTLYYTLCCGRVIAQWNLSAVYNLKRTYGRRTYGRSRHHSRPFHLVCFTQRTLCKSTKVHFVHTLQYMLYTLIFYNLTLYFHTVYPSLYTLNTLYTLYTSYTLYTLYTLYTIYPIYPIYYIPYILYTLYTLYTIYPI